MYYLKSGPNLGVGPKKNIDQLTNMFFLVHTSSNIRIGFQSPDQIQTALTQLSNEHSYLGCSPTLSQHHIIGEDPVSMTRDLLEHFPGSKSGDLIRNVGFTVKDSNMPGEVADLGFLEIYSPSSHIEAWR